MYSTGTATGPSAVLQALATFATSAGWTIDNNAAYSGGWWLGVHKGSCYLNFVTDSGDSQISFYGATGFSSGSAPSAQANTSPNSQNICNCGSGPFTGYHFFSSTGAAYLHCIIEISSGLFAHFQGGLLSSAGGASTIYVQSTNWQYSSYYASFVDQGINHMPWSNYPNGYTGATVDGTFRWFRWNNSSPSRAKWPLEDTGINFNGNARSPNTFNGLSPLLPVQCFLERAVGNIFAYVGDAPDMRTVNMRNYVSKDEITIGSDTWKVFPMAANSQVINVGNAPPSSGNYGLAFRKNA